MGVDMPSVFREVCAEVFVGVIAVTIICFTGLPGSGKSFLVKPLGLPTVSKDEEIDPSPTSIAATLLRKAKDTAKDSNENHVAVVLDMNMTESTPKRFCTLSPRLQVSTWQRLSCAACGKK